MPGADIELASAPEFLEPPEWEAIILALELCRRETQIVCGIMEAQSEAQLAANLGISTHTVHTYIDRLYRRLGVGSRCELVVRVFEAYARSARRMASV